MSNFNNTWDNYNVFWILCASVVVVFIIAMNIPNNNNIEYAKAGLEECPDIRTQRGTIWVKDCVTTSAYLKEGKILELSPNISKF